MTGRQLAIQDIRLPGRATTVALNLPDSMTFEQWVDLGKELTRVEGAVQWWLGDWWAFGEHKYGDRAKQLADVGKLFHKEFYTLAHYGVAARAFKPNHRRAELTFSHHLELTSIESERQRDRWLIKAINNNWSVNQLRGAIKQKRAADNTEAVELDAERLGRFSVIYADPPWQYEHPPMGSNTRSIENQYPTMEMSEICAMPVADVVHEDAVLFLWVTPPKLRESFQIFDAWDFDYRTNAVWEKDRIGMGYYFRSQHEHLLVGVRGSLPLPGESNRPSSIIKAPRLEHSAKPPKTRDIIDGMYPNKRKLELFARGDERRRGWTFWGNQAALQEAAE